MSDLRPTKKSVDSGRDHILENLSKRGADYQEKDPHLKTVFFFQGKKLVVIAVDLDPEKFYDTAENRHLSLDINIADLHAGIVNVRDIPEDHHRGSLRSGLDTEGTAINTVANHLNGRKPESVDVIMIRQKWI